MMYLELFGDLLSFAGNKRWSTVTKKYRLTVTKKYRPTVANKSRSMLTSSHRSTAKPPENNRFKQKYRHPTLPSIDVDVPPSIDRRPEFGRRAFDLFGTRKFYWEEKDEYGVYRNDQGCARDVDGHIINVSKDDIRKLMERASRDEHSYICLPEHASSFTQTKLVPEIYTKDEINEMLY
ncbi:hypothetical protein F2Q69_00006582 [Brassica cretica]|uniref:Uncharacterized protein n=1 Tax=Brassica cretica TaxID=69181 RepID=A0A8S9P2L8_BRACR|nr:hypothetical protein F2Q69_00006582 [Brassica cretica]